MDIYILSGSGGLPLGRFSIHIAMSLDVLWMCCVSLPLATGTNRARDFWPESVSLKIKKNKK